jgi:hypothetical protein
VVAAAAFVLTGGGMATGLAGVALPTGPLVGATRLKSLTIVSDASCLSVLGGILTASLMDPVIRRMAYLLFKHQEVIRRKDCFTPSPSDVSVKSSSLW